MEKRKLVHRERFNLQAHTGDYLLDAHLNRAIRHMLSHIEQHHLSDTMSMIFYISQIRKTEEAVLTPCAQHLMPTVNMPSGTADMAKLLTLCHLINLALNLVDIITRFAI
jgi:5-methylcytosine-specific restriction endonuclease McrBC regulatory subunit McrC